MMPITLDGWVPRLLVLLWVVAAAGMGAYCTMVARHITYVTLADGRRQERRLPMLFKLLIPLTPNVAPLFRYPVFEARRKAIARQVVSAGYESLISAEEFLGLRILMPLLMGPLWILMVRVAATAGNSALLVKLEPSLFMLGILWLALYPGMWLRAMIQTRHNEIQRALGIAVCAGSADALGRGGHGFHVFAPAQYRAALGRCARRGAHPCGTRNPGGENPSRGTARHV